MSDAAETLEPEHAVEDVPAESHTGAAAEAHAEVPEEAPRLARTVEALLFLSSDPLSPAELAEATEAGEGAVLAALALLAEQYAPGQRGIRLRELGGGWTLASDPASEEAARRLFSRPRAATLSPAQAETSRSSPTCSPCRGRRTPASAALAPTGQRHAARPRPERRRATPSGAV